MEINDIDNDRKLSVQIQNIQSKTMNTMISAIPGQLVLQKWTLTPQGLTWHFPFWFHPTWAYDLKITLYCARKESKFQIPLHLHDQHRDDVHRGGGQQPHKEGESSIQSTGSPKKKLNAKSSVSQKNGDQQNAAGATVHTAQAQSPVADTPCVWKNVFGRFLLRLSKMNRS